MDANINNTESQPKRKKFWKFWILMVLVNIGFFGVVIKLFTIQVINAEEYKDRAKRQHESRIELSAERGNIYDRNGNILAGNITTYSVAADPQLIEHKIELAKLLALFTGKEPQLYLDKINQATNRFVWLERGMQGFDYKQVSELKDRGIIILKEPQRIMPYSANGAQLIGMTDTDNKGRSAIELQWNSELIGQNGFMIMNRDALGNLMPAADLPLIEAVDGNSFTLTIDIDLQRIVEYELEAGVLRNAALNGTVVVLQPKTGEILAMASYPGFNRTNLRGTPVEARKIRAITDPYEPGSTFKVFTAAAAFDESLVSEDDFFEDYKDNITVSRRTIRDIHRLKYPTFRNAFIHSSNVIFSEVANRIPDYKIYKYLRDFGFGNRTDVDLPGEVSGRLPKPEDFSGISKRYLGQGYELLATPLQLAVAYAALANGGELMKPYIVKNIISNNGSIIQQSKPQLIRQVVSKKTTERIRDLLIQTVEEGTGRNAMIPGIKIAGKTGTSQQVVGGTYSKMNYNASFAGYFPADNPEIVMVVLIDSPMGNYYGGHVAAPIFKAIASRFIYTSKHILANNSINKDTVEIERHKPIIPYLIGQDNKYASNFLKNANINYENHDNNGIIISQLFNTPEDVFEEFTVQINDFRNLYLSDENEQKQELPELIGLTSKSAITIAHLYGYKVRLNGSGIVSNWSLQADDDGRVYMNIICK